jgi:flagellar basal body-associated protein FliL
VKKKLPIIAVVALVALGGAYKFVLAMPKAAEAKPKVQGTVYVLGKEFMVNLADGRFAKLTVALVLDPKDHSSAAASGHGRRPSRRRASGRWARRPSSGTSSPTR